MKCTKNIGAIQDLSVSTAVYSKEIYFYTDLYKQVNTAIRVPECYGVYFDAADKNRLQFCIVLEEFAKAVRENQETPCLTRSCPRAVVGVVACCYSRSLLTCALLMTSSHSKVPSNTLPTKQAALPL